MSAAKHLRVVRSPEEDISFTDVFHRINDVLPEDQRLSVVEPATLVDEALSLMDENGFSQVPVVAGNEVIGVFSYRSFAQKVVAIGEAQLDYGTLRVSEFLEELEYVHVQRDLDKTFELLNQHDAVLVGQPNELQGIVTPYDVVKYLYEVAGPFVMIAEMELAIRRLIEYSVSEEELEACIENCLSQQERNRKMPSQVDEMMFNDYVQLVGDGRNWPHFAEAFGSEDNNWHRQSTRAKLKELRDLRNAMFHFRRDLKKEEIDLIKDRRDWLLRLARIMEAQTAA